ncbi:transposase [Algivirga pacifica]|uniref:Transposase n=1 Tax=Algivirga pacifica TaxID=1162670 RepID=A0ABP9DC99_9BACT
MFEQELSTITVSISENQAIGIDWGVAHFLTLSNGSKIANPRLYQQYQCQLRVAQRSLARKKKRSQNFYKQARKLAKLQAKIARVRNDFQHKVSTDLVRSFDLIAIESLKVKNMSKSAKGDTEHHGKNVKAKSGLNRAIVDTAPSMFFDKLFYKAQWQGKAFIKVDAKYTSQRCHSCGYQSKENRISQSNFECKKCGHTDNADINAAKNILARAIASSRKRGALARA